jgi:hypothetical protein
MSATLAAGMYQHYFKMLRIQLYTWKTHHFPVEDVFLSDLPRRVKLHGDLIKKIASRSQDLLTMKCTWSPSIAYMKKLFTIVVNLAVVIGKPGTSV